MSIELNQLTELPDGLLHASARELEAMLGGPTLIHLQGKREPALFVSVLLHGNETTGFEAMKLVLRRYLVEHEHGDLPRSLSLFIGNVSAAARGLRRLDGQPDYNRVWPGREEHDDTPEAELMDKVTAIMRERPLFACVDIHNNSGLNPHYGCINQQGTAFYQLATLFSRTVVFFERPTGVQAMAFMDRCPSVILECGQPGTDFGVEHAARFVDACLHLSEIPEHPVAAHDMDLLETKAIVKLQPFCDFGFHEGAGIQFIEELDKLNFTELPAGTTLAHINMDEYQASQAFTVRDDEGNEHFGEYFEISDGQLQNRVPITPSMLTRDTRIIRQDCFCYLMEPKPFS
ncbi:MAG: M14 family metallopeptidase [Gammaproteobacteria bacterium]